MVNKEKFFKKNPISIAKQSAKLKLDFPNFHLTHNTNKSFTAIGLIQPTPLSTNYKVKITYTLGSRPNVFILSPDISISKRKIPHTYPNNELCLFYPKYKEWTKYDYISDKIVPWITDWLYYYEIWLITDKWLGGGIHPTTNTKKRKSIELSIK